jgi:hypothetical protein
VVSKAVEVKQGEGRRALSGNPGEGREEGRQSRGERDKWERMQVRKGCKFSVSEMKGTFA